MLELLCSSPGNSIPLIHTCLARLCTIIGRPQLFDLDVFLLRGWDNAIHKNAGQVHIIRIDRSNRDDILCFNNGKGSRFGHGRAKCFGCVAASYMLAFMDKKTERDLPEDAVPDLVCLPRS